jgi:chaperonin GroES
LADKAGRCRKSVRFHQNGIEIVRAGAETYQTTNLETHMAKITFRPNEDRILVEPAEAETKTASGLYIPDSAKEKPQKGKVVAVGEGLKDKPVTVKVGDQILYGKYSGTEIQIDGKEYLIMRNSDVFGII